MEDTNKTDTKGPELLHGDIWKLRKGDRRVMILHAFPDSVLVSSMTDRQSTIDRKRFLALFVKNPG